MNKNIDLLDHIVSGLQKVDFVQIVGLNEPHIEWWDESEYYALIANLKLENGWQLVVDHLQTYKDDYLSLPKNISCYWVANFPPEKQFGRTGGFSLQSFPEAIQLYLQNETGWEAPWSEDDYSDNLNDDDSIELLLDADNWHGNGTFTVLKINNEKMEVSFCDGKVFHSLSLDPLQYLKTALETVGWPYWQKMCLAKKLDTNSSTFEKLRINYFSPMLENIPDWFPNRGFKHLRKAVKRVYDKKEIGTHFPTLTKKSFS